MEELEEGDERREGRVELWVEMGGVKYRKRMIDGRD